jgi:hypothetical protein
MTTERTAAPNTGFASGGKTFNEGPVCCDSSSVSVESLVLRNPPERKARNRYVAFETKTVKQSN